MNGLQETTFNHGRLALNESSSIGENQPPPRKANHLYFHISNHSQLS